MKVFNCVEHFICTMQYDVVCVAILVMDVQWRVACVFCCARQT